MDENRDPLVAIGVTVQESVTFELRRKELLMNGVHTSFALLAAGHGYEQLNEYAATQSGQAALEALAEEYAIAFFVELTRPGSTAAVRLDDLRAYAHGSAHRIASMNDQAFRVLRMDSRSPLDWLSRTFLTIHERVALPLHAYCQMQRTDDWGKPAMGKAILCLGVIVDRLALG